VLQNSNFHSQLNSVKKRVNLWKHKKCEIMSKKLIRFDWAMKTLLRDKANFDILEGFLGALLNDDNIKILNETRQANSRCFCNLME